MTFDETRLEFPAVRRLLEARCVCDLGRTRVRALAPTTASAPLLAAIGLVRETMALLARREDPPISDLRDVSSHLARVARERAVLDPAELLEIHGFLETTHRMRRFFEERREDTPALHGLAMPLHHLPALIRSIDEKIARDATVRDSASETLQQLRSELRASERRITQELERMVRGLTESGDLQDDFFTLRNGRYVLPVKTSNRGRVPGIIHDSSNTGETVFIEPFVILEESNKLADLRLREREEIFRILLRVAGHLRDELNVLRTNLEILGEFDLVCAQARFGADTGGAFPSITGHDRPISLVAAHHPLLYAADPANSRPLDLALDTANRALVITGPNAGGKTTALKTLGLTAIMVQCAVPVPLDSRSHLPLFDGVLAAIGDDQSVLDGESTFSSNMRRIVRILAEAGPGSLALLDELGTATDPGEGGALAVAILESLADRGALTIVSTHLAILKNWAADHPAGRNASFRLDPRSHLPTFRLQLDIPGISEALIVAEQVGLPPDLIARARSLRPKDELDASSLILSLQRNDQKLAEELAAAQQARAELEAAKIEADVMSQRFAEKQKRLRAEMLAEKERVITELKAQFEAVLAHQPSKQQLDTARRELVALAAETRAEKTDAKAGTVDLSTLRPGNWVAIKSLGEAGQVEEVIARRNEVRVTVKGMAVTVKQSDLAPHEGPKAAAGGAETQRGFGFKRPADMSVSMDLHGMRVHEALEEVDRFMDKALAAGLGFVRLVHGHGTGAIRRALHEHLRGHALVKHYRHGSPAEGGGSVTMVDLK